MSASEDLVTVAKDAKQLYKAAKKVAKELDDEVKVAKGDLDELKEYSARLMNILQDLPTEMTRAERRRFISATKATIEERLKFQDIQLDFEERLKLNAQLFTLENQEAKLALIDQFDVSKVVDAEALEKLRLNVADAQKEISAQIRARGYTRVAIRLAILAVDAGVLIAKAA